MVLVAAVAAGVLIKSAGALQEQARATGQDTIRRVAVGVNVVGIKGRVSEGYENVENMELVVKLRAGSPGINLEDMTIEYLSETTEKHLNMGKWENADGTFLMAFENRQGLKNRWDNLDGNEFAVVQVLDASNSKPQQLASIGDVVEIWINVDKVEENYALQEEEEVSLLLSPRVGLSTHAKAVVPHVLAGRRVVSL